MDEMRVAKMLYSMAKKDREREVGEVGKFTWSDEYPWARPVRPGFVPVSAEQRAEWEALAAWQRGERGA